MNEFSVRRIDIFFYGLFMDKQILINNNVNPYNPRKGFIENTVLYIGQRATLAPSRKGKVYGMLYSLIHTEIDQLYNDQGLKDYRAEAVLATCYDGTAIAALCYNLPFLPVQKEYNIEYANHLKQVLIQLNFPNSYINNI